MTDLSIHPDARRLHPTTLLQRVLVSLPALVVILLPVMRNPGAESWFSLAAALLYGMLALPLIVLQYLRFRYWITPREIVIRSGVFTVKQRSIPIDRIQNIEIEQPLLPRLLGTAKVKIETAGSSATEGVLEYVALEEARSIREVVRRFQRSEPPAYAKAEAYAEPASSPADAADPADAPAPAEMVGEQERPEMLYAMPLERVLLSGVFRFSLLYIAVIFSGLEYLGLTPEDVVDWLTRGRQTWVETAPPVVLVLASLTSAAVLAWLTGIAVNLNRYYGFRLTREGRRLHKRHGLLTVSEGTIPLRRVQAIVYRTNPLMRRFGWTALALQTMGLDARERAYQVAAPLADEATAQAVAGRILPLRLPETLHLVSRLTIRRAAIRYSLALAAAVGATAFFWQPAFWGLAAWPLLLYLAVLRYRRHGYAFDGTALVVRRGVFRQQTWLIPAERFQVFYRTASIFQRRLGLASVYADTAGVRSFAAPAVVDLPADEADALLEALYADFQAGFNDDTPTTLPDALQPPDDTPPPDAPPPDAPPPDALQPPEAARTRSEDSPR